MRPSNTSMFTPADPEDALEAWVGIGERQKKLEAAATGGLHGHSRRERSLWGPPEVGEDSVRRVVWLRRYRCVVCEAVCTVAPRGIATRFLYATTAIASGLLLWGVWLWSAARCRLEVSPDRLRGISEPQRWRSLNRWVRRTANLFALQELDTRASGHDLARRIGHLLVGRGPPDLDQHRRAVQGALIR